MNPAGDALTDLWVVVALGVTTLVLLFGVGLPLGLPRCRLLLRGRFAGRFITGRARAGPSLCRHGLLRSARLPGLHLAGERGHEHAARHRPAPRCIDHSHVNSFRDGRLRTRSRGENEHRRHADDDGRTGREPSP